MNLKASSLISVTLFFVLVSSGTYAQKQMFVGLNVNNNIYPDQIELNTLNIGATFETKITKHSGVETGLFYRADRTTDVISYSDGSGAHSNSLTIARRYLSVPVLYKYYSKMINLSAGPAFDFFAGWKQKQDDFPNLIQSYTVNPKVKVGFLIKASKIIPVNEKFIVEPEIRFGSVQTVEQANVGIGIAGKYRL